MDLNTDVIEQAAVQVSTPARASAEATSSTKAWLEAIELISRIDKLPGRLFADVVEDWAKRQPGRAALISDIETFDYATLDKRINRHARWALSEGLRKGDTVALLMANRPDYLACWLGISRVGGVVALINPELVGQSLAHCIDVAAPSHIIVAEELADVLHAAAPHLKSQATIWVHGGERNGTNIDAALEQFNDDQLSPDERGDVSIDDRALLIYTSGTTGLPKAASISHRRILNWGYWFAGLTGASVRDRLYDCLPVCHSVGGVVAPCGVLASGGSVVLAERFSASEFWNDIVRFDCTMFQYTGELCRDLLEAPPSEYESVHSLRMVCGNGLRGDIREDFQARFAIPRILEFYAATDGNFSLNNVEGENVSTSEVVPA